MSQTLPSLRPNPSWFEGRRSTTAASSVTTSQFGWQLVSPTNSRPRWDNDETTRNRGGITKRLRQSQHALEHLYWKYDEGFCVVCGDEL